MHTYGQPSADTQEALDAAYLAHHFNCPQCIAAGRGPQYGFRCDVGAPLWLAYVGMPATPTEEAA